MAEAAEGRTEEQREAWINYWTALCDAVQIFTKDPGGIAAFLIARGRVPNAEERDGRKPWDFRGWMLPYVMDMFPAGGFPGRWGWWYRSLTAGSFPEGEGVPPWVQFDHGSDVARRNLDKCVQIIGHQMGFGMAAVGELVGWLGWGLATTKDQPRIPEKVALELYRTLNLGAMLSSPSDYLGWLMSEYKGRGKDPTAFFPTPHGLVSMMTRMNLGEPAPEKTLRSVMDPCVGTGRFLLEASNWSVRLYGCDINPRCVAATLVNGALYAPWLAFPLVTITEGAVEGVEVRDTLRDPPTMPSGKAVTEPLVYDDNTGQALLFPEMKEQGDGPAGDG